MVFFTDHSDWIRLFKNETDQDQITSPGSSRSDPDPFYTKHRKNSVLKSIITRDNNTQCMLSLSLTDHRLAVEHLARYHWPAGSVGPKHNRCQFTAPVNEVSACRGVEKIEQKLAIVGSPSAPK